MEPFLAEIRMFGGNFAPRAWAFCNGQLLSIAQNQALFSLLGTTYGGDGRTTFALPDLRGRVAIHSGTGPGLTPRPLGQRSGEQTHTLINSEIPSHQHFITNGAATVTGAGSINVGKEGKGVSAEDTAADNFIGNVSGGFRTAAGSGTLNPASVSVSASISGATNPDGGSQAHNNMQPYLVINYIIALQGVFPSRN